MCVIKSYSSGNTAHHITTPAIASPSNTNTTTNSSSLIACTGNNQQNQNLVPLQQQTNTDVVEVAAGQAHSCAVFNRVSRGRQSQAVFMKLVCWGLNSSGQTDIPGSQAKTDLGLGGAGQDAGVGNPDVANQYSNEIKDSVRINQNNFDFPYNQSASGPSMNTYSNHYANSNSDSLPSDKSLHTTAVSCGSIHTCSLRLSGEPTCWGWNHHDQVTIPYLIFDEHGDIALERQPLRQLLLIRAGYAHTCAVNFEDSLYCWGNNVYGQCQTGKGVFAHGEMNAKGNDRKNRSVNNDNANSGQKKDRGVINNNNQDTTDILAVACGQMFTCIVRNEGFNGVVHCWGQSRPGFDVMAGNGMHALGLSAGLKHYCAEDIQYNVTCQGSNEEGQIKVPKIKRRIKNQN